MAWREKCGGSIERSWAGWLGEGSWLYIGFIVARRRVYWSLLKNNVDEDQFGGNDKLMRDKVFSIGIGGELTHCKQVLNWDLVKAVPLLFFICWGMPMKESIMVN